MNRETWRRVKSMTWQEADRLLHEIYDPVTRTYSTEPYWVCGGNNHIVYWMPLPKIPED